MHFQSANLQWLYGDGFDPNDEHKHIITFEYVQTNAVGDVFLFADSSRPFSGNTGWYGELAPRISLSSLTDKGSSAGLVKDVLLAANFEKPEGRDIRRLFGLAADLNVPGFTFFKTHAYHRDDPALPGDTWQLTLVWNASFTLGNLNLLAEGFADVAGGEGDGVAHQLVVPRLLANAGKLLGAKSGKLYAGIEFSYWHNKFGIDGMTESVPQLQLKWVL